MDWEIRLLVTQHFQSTFNDMWVSEDLLFVS